MIAKVQFQNTCYESYSLTIIVKLLPGKCYKHIWRLVNIAMLAAGTYRSDSYGAISNTCYELYSLTIIVKLLPCKCYKHIWRLINIAMMAAVTYRSDC